MTGMLRRVMFFGGGTELDDILLKTANKSIIYHSLPATLGVSPSRIPQSALNPFRKFTQIHFRMRRKVVQITNVKSIEVPGQPQLLGFGAIQG